MWTHHIVILPNILMYSQETLLVASCGTLIQSLIVIKNPDYAAPGWQGAHCFAFPSCWSVLCSTSGSTIGAQYAECSDGTAYCWILARSWSSSGTSPHVPRKRCFLLDLQDGGGWQTMASPGDRPGFCSWFPRSLQTQRPTCQRKLRTPDYRSQELW